MELISKEKAMERLKELGRINGELGNHREVFVYGFAADAVRQIEPQENKLVYICSPYRGDIERNTEYARELTRIALDCGYTPITPHLYLTQVLNEEDPEQRKRGVEAGAELLKGCRYIFIGSRYGLSAGMLVEIQIALEQGITELAQEKGGLVEVYGGSREDG